MHRACALTRRMMLASGACALAAGRGLAQASIPTGRDLSFEVLRNGRSVGRHTVQFRGDASDMDIVIDARLAFSFGLIPIRYHHQASETWRQGRFVSLRSQTHATFTHDEQVSAERTAQGISVTTATGAHELAEGTHPLTHWNPAVLDGPLFNPQTGAMIREAVVRSAGQTVRLPDGRDTPATRFALTGSAQITDWYDASMVWLALQGKGPDGSMINYRRSA